MSDTQTPQQKTCSKCGQPVIDAGDGAFVHAGGGAMMQKCRNCGWTGGQVGKYQNCPRCGDQTALVDDHMAS